MLKGGKMNEQQEQFAKRLDEIRETVRELMYVTLGIAELGYQNGLYDMKKPWAKEVFGTLKILIRKYQKKAAGEETERRSFEKLDGLMKEIRGFEADG